VLNLNDNVYNRNTSPASPKLKLWRYAGADAHISLHCPLRVLLLSLLPGCRRSDADRHGLGVWQSLIDLAGPAARVHITGGEPFLFYDHLVELLAQAAAAA